MVKLKIKKNDEVIVISGQDKGKKGKVLAVYPKEKKVIVAGVGVAKRHTKPSATSQGGIQSVERKIDLSNIAIVDPKEGKATKVGYRFIEGKDKTKTKVRFAKQSGEDIV